MRKALFILILAIISSPAFSKNSEKPDIFSDSFMELGRYVETFETNEPEEGADVIQMKESDIFEEEAITDVSQRYEENAVELKFDNDSENALESVNNERIYKLRINEDQFNIENGIRNENMIWDSSKLFTQAYINDSRHMAPIPSVINSSKITAYSGNSLSASLGQAYLYDANGPSLLFIRANESTYNTGAVLSYKGKGLNISTGSFSSSFNNAASGGAIISTTPVKLPFNTGSFLLGGGYFANEEQVYNKSTGGGFIEYDFKRLKLNAQVAQSRYSNADNVDTSVYFVPEFQLTDSLFLKSRFIRNITKETMQDEFGITYRPKFSNNNFEFEINTINQYTKNENINHRIKFSTSFKI